MLFHDRSWLPRPQSSGSFTGLVLGTYDARAESFVLGGADLHKRMT